MRRPILICLLILTALRLFVGSRMELSPDEAYYYQWSQRLDWAYYSKGPGVAAAIRLGTALFGPTELGVRFLSPLLALGTSLILFAMARRLYGPSVALWTVVAINVTPIFQAGSIVMTIDALSIFFWAAALWTFWLALEHSHAADRWQIKRPTLSGFWFWPLTGLMMALGFLSKYTNALQLLSIVLVIALTPRFRSEFRKPGFWAMVAAFLLGVIPPLVWNAKHDWITAEHLWSRGNLDTPFRFRPGEVFAFLGLHFGVYSPLIFAGMLTALYQGCRFARTHFKPRFLILFTLPLLGMYFLLSIKKCGEANWTAPAFVSLTILTVAFWHERVVQELEFAWITAATERARSFPTVLSSATLLALSWLQPRRFALAALAFGMFLSLFLVNTDVVRRLGIHYSYQRDPTGRLRGWKTAAIAIDDLRHRLEKQNGKPLFLIANRYQSTASLCFYLPEKRVDGPGHPPVYIPESQAIENQFSFWGRYDELIETTELARMLLPTVTDPLKRDALADALRGAADPQVPKEGADADERRRALIRALLAVNPALPLDEYASQEMGVSLFQGRDALYISDHDLCPPTSILRAFEKFELVANWDETRRGLPLRSINVYLCRNYRNLPL